MKSISSDLLAQMLAESRATNPAEPVNRLLYCCLRAAIHDRRLPSASRLPPSRDLAAELGISRNTVIYAYEQLILEGYANAVTGSGTFVIDRFPDLPVVTPQEQKCSVTLPLLKHTLSARGRAIVNDAYAPVNQWGAFMPGVPDITRAPQKALASIANKLSERMSPSLLSYASKGGNAVFHENLVAYLRQARSVNCKPNQIIVTEGVHQAIDLITRVLADVGDHAWVENPGYWGTRTILLSNGLTIQGINVDEEGMNIPKAMELCEKAPKFAFVTPSHQYPLGSVMSMRRRFELIAKAKADSFWIVEDDYDSEFRSSGLPIPSLQGLVPDAPVIYIGTFSKTLYPGLRIAYMIAPPEISEALRTAHSELYRGGHLQTQAAIAQFISDGKYAAHVRRMRLVYSARRAVLINMILKSLGKDWIHPFDTDAGLHLILSLPPESNDVEISEILAEKGVLTRPLSRFYVSGPVSKGLLLGFACVAPEEMLAPFSILLGVIRRNILKI
ncbi:MocR-like pyridoxine biosynthesis transcription factor PdxR [Comamonas sp. MYb396]|uniref:MocR-like pyridoxine biosynthesis transcription factor PdxR n=1 Tax=Comamonas sp. MYb396 TaxID=2745302 RepID=UPI00309A9B2E